MIDDELFELAISSVDQEEDPYERTKQEHQLRAAESTIHAFGVRNWAYRAVSGNRSGKRAGAAKVKSVLRASVVSDGHLPQSKPFGFLLVRLFRSGYAACFDYP